ncbi:CDP-glycerol glycerophosphotransferase family protein [Weissella kandleri]|uniref:CDP-glycerol glycerophosphotransferase family protein n=1 Tax=Weissella kandleri TaxID=1616 RepID=UPI00387E46A9
MELLDIKNNELIFDEEERIYIKNTLEDNKYIYLGETNNFKLKISLIDEYFKRNDLPRGKYLYFFKNELGYKSIEAHKINSLINAYGTSRQKSFYSYKGLLHTMYPNLDGYEYKMSLIIENMAETSIFSIIQSLQKQTIGFSNLEIIILNTDNDKVLSEEEQDLISNYINITVVEDNNDLVVLKNKALQLSKGELVSFYNFSKKLEKNMLELVYTNFKTKNKYVDVIATSKHTKETNKIISLFHRNDLTLDLFNNIYVRNDSISEKYFDDFTLFADAIKDKMNIVVLKDNVDGPVKSFDLNKEYYNKLFKSYDNVPLVLQNSLVKYLNYKIRENNKYSISDVEKEITSRYIDFQVINRYIDDKFIKYYLYDIKGKELGWNIRNNGMTLTRGNVVVFNYAKDIHTRFITINKKGSQFEINFEISAPGTYVRENSYLQYKLKIGNTELTPNKIVNSNVNNPKYQDSNIRYYEYVQFVIEDKENIYNNPFKIYVEDDFRTLKLKVNSINNYLNAIELNNSNSIQKISNKVNLGITRHNNLILKKSSESKDMLLDFAFGKNYIDLFMYKLKMKHKTKLTWLFEDRGLDAGDNAEAMFEYVTKHHPEIDAYYVISKKSEDFKRVAKIGKVVDAGSREHKLLWSVCDAIVTAHILPNIYNPYFKEADGRKFAINNKNYIFLQHGVFRAQHSLSPFWNIGRRNFNIIITSANYEFNEFIKPEYFYDESVVKLTGMARQDLLINSKIARENWIAFMPTWRAPYKNLTDEEFVKTEYYKEVNSFLKDKKLLTALDEKNFKIIFKIHPEFKKYEHLFQLDGEHVITSDLSYNQLFLRSKIAITDFSSAILDFAYMKRPIIQYMFDKDSFFNGHHGKNVTPVEPELYGHVWDDYDSFINELILKIDVPEMDDNFKKKIDSDFPHQDGKNRDRIFNEIMKTMDL